MADIFVLWFAKWPLEIPVSKGMCERASDMIKFVEVEHRKA